MLLFGLLSVLDAQFGHHETLDGLGGEIWEDAAWVAELKGLNSITCTLNSHSKSEYRL